MKANTGPRRSPQSIYAESLHHCMDQYGYPLLSPKPSSTLGESYQKQGLKIGDVGYVNPDGIFCVCCNVRCKPDAKTNSRVVPGFQNIVLDEKSDVEINLRAIPSPMVIKSPRITEDHCDTLSAPRVFRPGTSPGAILILPSGARFESLQNSAMDKFRRIAEEYGHDWCMMAPSDFKSVLLVTGLYKARSWSLGYFKDPQVPEKITVTPQDDRLPPEKYMWVANSTTIFASEHSEESESNQTVFLRGFRVTKRAKQDRSCLAMLWAFVNCLRRSKAVEVQHEPNFTHHFDFSGEINRRLLEKFPAADIAITHDDEWTHILSEVVGLCDISTQVDCVVESLLRDSVSVSTVMCSHGVVSLRKKTFHPSPAKPASFPTLKVIKSLRVTNSFSDIKRMPFGFYIQIDDKRTTTKLPLINDSIIEWIEELPLPDLSEKVQLSLCAIFGPDPILGGREVLHTIEIDVRDFAETTYHMLEFCSGEPPARQLFLTLGERLPDSWEARSDHCFGRSCMGPSHAVANRTALGHDSLARYYKDYKNEDITEAVEHFEHALNDLFPQDHGYTTALFNLTTARLNKYVLDGTHTDIYPSVISPYLELLDLLPAGHIDIPATSLYLAQALLYRYETHWQNYEEFPDLKIEELMEAIKHSCPVDSHAQQARNLVLQTFKRLKLVRSSNFENLDELLAELDAAVRDCPEGYFDKPRRLVNLGIALQICSQRCDDSSVLSYLDRSVVALESAIRLTPPLHPDKAAFLINLSTALLTRFGKRSDPSDLGDLTESIKIIAEAERLVPNGHMDRAACLRTFGVALLQRFEQNSDFTDINRSTSLFDEALGLIRSENPYKAAYLHCLGVSLLRRFDVRTNPRDLTDIDRSISLNGEASQLVPIEHPDRVTYLHSFSTALLRRFDICEDSGDLGRHIVTLEEILRLVPNTHSDKALYLHSLEAARRRCSDLHLPPQDSQTFESILLASRPQPAPRCSNVVLFGEMGTGKSSVVNLILGHEAARISSGLVGPTASTFDTRPYGVTIQGQDFRIFDTVGVNDPRSLSDPDTLISAINNAYYLVKNLSKTGGIHLLLLCIRRRRITTYTQRNYKLFCDFLCHQKVPVALVVTNLEHEPNTEVWWQYNASHFAECGLHAVAHACITAKRDINFIDRYDASRKMVRDLLLAHGCGKGFTQERISWVTKLFQQLLKLVDSRPRLDALSARAWKLREYGLRDEELNVLLRQICAVEDPEHYTYSSPEPSDDERY